MEFLTYPLSSEIQRIILYITRFQTEADFSPQQKIPILGRDGFFRFFESVVFNEKGKFLYLNLVR